MITPFTDSSCYHMWSGMFISPSGHIRLCCVSREGFLSKDYHHIDSIEDLQEFFNSEAYLNKRNSDVRSMDICAGCHAFREKVNAPVLKNMIQQTYNKSEIVPATNPENCLLEHLEVSFGSLCNQQCMMCRSDSSSKWYKFDKENENNEFERSAIKYKKWGTSDNIDKIKRLLPQIKLLVIKGGEPTIQHEVYEILQEICYKEFQTKVSIVSNFQEVSDEMMELICQLPNAKMTFSVDSTGSRYNWVRGGDFDKTMRNIETYVKRCNMPSFGFANTLNNHTVKHIVEDVKIMENINSKITKDSKTFPWYSILSVMGPRYASPFILPREERLDIVNQFECEFGFIESDTITYKTLILNNLATILALENDAFENTEDYVKLSKKWEEKINNIRGFNLL